MCPAAFPSLERQPSAKGTGELVSVPDKEFFKDRTLKKKKIKKKGGWGEIFTSAGNGSFIRSFVGR